MRIIDDLKKNIFEIIFFTFLALIGLLIFQDFGLYLDEDNSRENGFVSLKYISEIVYPNFVLKIDEIINVSKIDEYYQQGNGVVFDVPAAFLEIFFNLKDSRSYYLLRHLLNYLIFVLSLIYFYKIIIKKYESKLIAFIGVFFLYFSPRIFAESFYNTKDIFFMSLFILATYSGLYFLEKKTFLSGIIFSIISGLMVDVRILGVFFPLLVFLLFFINLLREKIVIKKHAISLIISILFFPIFIVIFWPYLWSNPIVNFVSVFQNLANHDIDIYNFYFGEYISARGIPWHYSLVWIFITTPLLYTFLFLIGFFFIIKRMIERLLKIEENSSYIDLWRNKKELQDLIFVFSFLIPVISVITLDSTLYDGWRHLYFVYPSIILIALFGLHRLFLWKLKRKKKIFFSFIIILFLPNILWIYQNHPHQNVYFNILVKKEFNKNFEMDYWGISNKSALEFIVKNDSRNKINIFNINTTDLNLSKKILEKFNRDKINVVDSSNNADYIIINYRDWKGNTKPDSFNIPLNFKIYNVITVDGVIINTTYKK
jgi:hypothetical protein